MTNTYRLSGGSGYGCYGWRERQLVPNTRPGGIEAGEPEYLVVLEADRVYYDSDGECFGVGSHRGYVYSATCRAATDEEARPLREALARREKAKEATEELDAICDRIRQEGERPYLPTGKINPEGEQIAGPGPDPYGGGWWIVAGDEWLWYIRNNGGDGNDWSVNNIRTGGAGAVGWRVPADRQVVDRIRALWSKISD